MKTFQIEILETLIRTVDVQALNSKAAEDLVRKRYANQEIVLDSSDFMGVNINELNNI